MIYFNLSSYPDFDTIILGAIGNGNNIIYFDDYKCDDYTDIDYIDF